MKTILITGCSSGFGLETAKFFLDKGWKVIATMRRPKEGLFPQSDNLRILPLDVTKAESISKVIAEAGPIDVLVNNAGIGLLAPVESTDMKDIRDVFETNTLGTIAMTQAVLPQFRERRSGMIINVTSTVTVKPLLLLAAYTASKSAVNAFTESLALELEPFNVKVRLVLPGLAPTTNFTENALPRMHVHEAYKQQVDSVFQGFKDVTEVTHARDVAEKIWEVANDPDSRMRNPAGKDAVTWAKATGYIE